jgi:hypothetical protein
MKKLLLMMAITAIVGTAVAQDQNQQNQKSKDKTEWYKQMRTELNLTTEQATKFDAINQEYDSRFNALDNDPALNNTTREERKMTLKKEKEARLFEFFTPEQQTKYRELMEKKKKDKGVKPSA